MTAVNLQHSLGSSATAFFTRVPRQTVPRYECELTRLRVALALAKSLLHQKTELIRQQDVLGKEADHRLLNSLQIIVSLLSLQSRAAAYAETAWQLAVAAKRVAMIERVHRRLHSVDGAKTVAFRQYLEELCRDFSTMFSSEEGPEQVIAVEGIEIELRSLTAIPLGFIVSELITNAVKYGQGQISVRLEPNGVMGGYALSVSNNGPILPEGFDLAACNGLGMKIIRSFIGQIGGELRLGRSDNNHGTRFTVLFS